MKMITGARQISAALWLAALICFPSIHPSAYGQPLAVSEFQVGPVNLGRVVSSMTVSVGFGSNTFAVLFDQFALTPADSGHTFTLNENNDPDFANARITLENGNPDLVVFTYGVGVAGTGLTSESNYFYPLPPGSNGIDLQGFSIGSISLVVDSLTLTTPGSNPNGTDIYFRGRIAVNAVPEPSTFAMAGLAGLIFLRRFHSSKGSNA